MFDKIKRIEEFSHYFEYSIRYLVKYVSTSSRNLSLVNVNISFISSMICSGLRQEKLRIKKPTLNGVISYGSLGDLLRHYIDHKEESEKYDVLVLDFYGSLSGLFANDDELAESINVNRDLFSRAFNSTIIIAPQLTTYKIKRKAIDFWSCLDNYIDTTKWLSSPLTFPFVKIRIKPDMTSYFIDLYQNNSEAFLEYQRIKNSILEIDTYSTINFLEFYNDIVSFYNTYYHKACYIDLMYCYVDKLTNVHIQEEFISDRMTFLNKFLELDLEESEKNKFLPVDIHFIDCQFLLAEFYYKCGEYANSLEILCVATSILEQQWDADILSTEIFAYLDCNKLICRYMMDRVHMPKTLLREIELRLSGNKYISKEYSDFKDTYITLVDLCSEHHSFVQHNDFYRKIIMNSVTNLPMIDISESVECVLLWEKFVINNFSGDEDNNHNLLLMNLYDDIHKMINFFINDEYQKARKMYMRCSKGLKEQGYLQIFDIVALIWKNMQYLNRCNKKFDLYFAL